MIYKSEFTNTLHNGYISQFSEATKKTINKQKTTKSKESPEEIIQKNREKLKQYINDYFYSEKISSFEKDNLFKVLFYFSDNKKDDPNYSDLISEFDRLYNKQQSDIEKETLLKNKRGEQNFKDQYGLFTSFFKQAYKAQEEKDFRELDRIRNELFNFSDKLEVDRDFLQNEYKKYKKEYDKIKKEEPKVKKIISTKFDIPEKIPTDLFQIEGDFSKVKQWKAKTLLANSGGKKGAWDRVRYVMISLKDNTIIPIAISDEHQTGYELMWNFYSKKYGITVNQYYSLCSWGNHYIYSKDELKGCAIAGEKYIKWGGNPKLEVNINEQVFNKSMIVPLKDIVKYKANPEKLIPLYGEVKNKILPFGKEFLKQWQNLSKSFNAGRNSMSPSIVKQLAKKTIDVIEWQDENSFYTGSQEYIPVLKMFLKGIGDFQDLENFVFGFSDKNNEYIKKVDLKNFNGIKNYIHNNLRSNADSNFKSDYEAKVGDLDLLIKMYGNL